MPSAFALTEALRDTPLLPGLAARTPGLRRLLRKRTAWVPRKAGASCGPPWSSDRSEMAHLPERPFLSHEPRLLSARAFDSSAGPGITGTERARRRRRGEAVSMETRRAGSVLCRVLSRLGGSRDDGT